MYPVGHSLKVVTLEEEVSPTSSEYKSSPLPLPLPPSYDMSQQQQQQQEEVSLAPTPCQQSLPTREEQLLAMIATLQQQVNTMLLHQQGSRIEVTKPQVFGYKEAKLQAGIKPTALCSAIDKENSIESLLDFAILYIQLLLWLYTLSPTVLMSVS